MNQDELLTERQNERESDKQNYRNAERQKDKSQKDKEMERRMEGIQVLMMMIIRAGRGRWRRWNTDEIDADGRRLNRCDLEF